MSSCPAGLKQMPSYLVLKGFFSAAVIIEQNTPQKLI